MADDRIIALDIGSQQVSGASFSKTSGGGLQLEKFHRSDLVGDPFDDAARTAQSKMALKEVVGKHEKKAKLCYIARNKVGAVQAMRMAHSCREKLSRQETIRQELMSFLEVSKKHENDTSVDVEDQREALQMILDGQSRDQLAEEFDLCSCFSFSS